MLEYRTNVLLPEWIWREAKDKEHLKSLIIMYMSKSYPHYKILKIKGQFAICERK